MLRAAGLKATAEETAAASMATGLMGVELELLRGVKSERKAQLFTRK